MTRFVWANTRFAPSLGVIGGLLAMLVLILILVPRSASPTKSEGPEPVKMWAAGSPVTSISFSPNDQLLAVGLRNGSIELRRISDGTLLHTLKGHADEVSVVAFSPDGLVLASGESFLASHAGIMGSIPQATIRLWSIQDGTLLRTLPGQELAVEALAFSPNGKVLASDGARSAIRIWTTADGHLRSEFQGDPTPWDVFKLAFSPDGQELTVADGSGVVQQWDLSKGALLHSYNDPYIEVGGEPRSLDISRDGRIFVGSDSGDPTVYVWQVGSDHISTKYSGHRSGVGVIALSPDSKWGASAGGYKITGSDDFVGKDNAIHVWQVDNAKDISVLDGFDGTVTGLAWSSDKQLLASGNDDGTVRLWEVK